MADPVIPSTPQQFRFGTQSLYGSVTGYEGFTDYRSVSHTFLKLDGGLEEPMGRGQRRLEVRIAFIGADCAKRYQAFAAYVDGNRTATLMHPIAGQWTAFCKGFGHRIAFAVATNQIDVPVTFVESQLDATIPSDTPSITVATQNATDQQSQFQQTVAAFLAKIAKAQTASTAAINALDSALAQVSAVVTAPVDFMASEVNLALGAASAIVGVVANIKAASDNFTQSVTNFLSVASDIFDGTSDSATLPPPDQIATLVGNAASAGATLEAALFAAPSTPAGCADAIADVEVMVDACMTLADAIAASQPPTTVYTVPVTQALLVLAQRLIDELGLSYDALTYGSAILNLNRIQNPAAIPAGTQLTIPTA